jgi:serine/threonine protein kinase
MKRLTHPFLVGLCGVAQNNRAMLLYSHFFKNGNLEMHLQKVVQMDLGTVKFYAAQIVIALEYMHSCYRIHRDLKPANILIGDDGYIGLADFGFTKKVCPWDRTYTICGTPDYMAPEIWTN